MKKDPKFVRVTAGWCVEHGRETVDDSREGWVDCEGCFGMWRVRDGIRDLFARGVDTRNCLVCDQPVTCWSGHVHLLRDELQKMRGASDDRQRGRRAARSSVVEAESACQDGSLVLLLIEETEVGDVEAFFELDHYSLSLVLGPSKRLFLDPFKAHSLIAMCQAYLERQEPRAGGWSDGI